MISLRIFRNDIIDEITDWIYIRIQYGIYGCVPDIQDLPYGLLTVEVVLKPDFALEIRQKTFWVSKRCYEFPIVCTPQLLLFVIYCQSSLVRLRPDILLDSQVAANIPCEILPVVDDMGANPFGQSNNIHTWHIFGDVY